MVEISKEERDIIVERLPDTYIIRTMKRRSKRHHYSCEESKAVMSLLREIRSGASNEKAGAAYGFGKARE